MSLVGLASPTTSSSAEHKRVRQLERTIGDLRQRIRDLEGLLMPTVRVPVEWALSHRETQVLEVLVGADVVSLQRLAFALYADAEKDIPPETAQCHISKLRRKLRPYGGVITNRRHLGYSLNDRLLWKAKLS